MTAMFKLALLLFLLTNLAVGSHLNYLSRRCKPLGAPCEDGSVCCSETCSKIDNGGQTCAPFSQVFTKKCLEVGEPCIASQQCCSNHCFLKSSVFITGMCMHL